MGGAWRGSGLDHQATVCDGCWVTHSAGHELRWASGEESDRGSYPQSSGSGCGCCQQVSFTTHLDDNDDSNKDDDDTNDGNDSNNSSSARSGCIRRMVMIIIIIMTMMMLLMIVIMDIRRKQL